MSRRVIPCSFGAAGLLLVALALWLPIDFASRSHADPDTEPATSDVKLVASEAAFFVTFRPADFTGDELVKAIIQDIPKSIEDELHVSTYGIERLTVAVVRHGPVQIVRTKKPYDANKVREAIIESRFGGFKDKDIKDGAPAKPAVNEKKAGGKKIYYVGESNRWTRGWCPIDKNTFMEGSLAAIETLLTTKGKPSAEMTDALALASSHSLVLALDGKRLRTMMKQSREDGERERMEWQKKREDRFKDGIKDTVKDTIRRIKDSSRRDPKPSRGEVFVSAKVRAEAAAEEAKDDDDLDLLFGSFGAGGVMLPYKPLLSARFGLLTLDIKKTYKLTAKIDFANKDEMDDGETALKSLLYVGRQLAVILPKHEHEFKGMKSLSVLAQKAIKEAKVARKDTTLTASITLTPEAGLAKKVREGIAEERKNQEGRYGKKDRPMFKDTVKDKVRIDKD